MHSPGLRWTMNKVGTGIIGLDKLMGGGFPSNTVVLLSGGPGSGKTLLGLNYLVNNEGNKSRCCYVSLNESEEELLRACSQIDSLKKAESMLNKSLSIVSLELDRDLDIRKFTEIISSYPEMDKLVLDNINKLLMYSRDEKEYRLNLSRLVSFLREKVKSSLLLCETPNGDLIDTGNGEAFECDGVVRLSFSEYEEKPKRVLELYKMRYTSFNPKISHELIINNKGLDITETKIL